MSEFRLYLDLGVFHILDFAGYDHMLFVMAIAAIYLLNDWRKVLYPHTYHVSLVPSSRRTPRPVTQLPTLEQLSGSALQAAGGRRFK